ncbi:MULTISPECIES: Swt1 family HEPN domain-containing protein [Acetobacter]|uniref:Swt1-like HEPN domain-containing protein n=2 Tax=Acetobacter TaxID=434 RepID=A0AAN1PG09_9PROT|nr:MULTISPECIES: Swt1 family HEPN domain-containing protein [Acetobacter]ASL41146.1 hypothetical protein CBI36_12620 [Acetobacter oryzifermentans]AXM99530.1 hypothetical protein CJF59_02300 [Acetobacter pomorum]KAA8394142.1 hypothetical protein FKW20_13845 [Acetobacter sp. DmW_125127]KAA8396762.1 hypothetical protein FKW22_05645 [Acetobacter sp. DmW_125124]KAA8399847.1 hypothetical protein FKW19_02900 [Acetobacter sp. DmW_125128]
MENDPLNQMTKALENHPLNQMMKAMDNHPLNQMMKAIDNHPLNQMMKAMDNHPLNQMMKAMDNHPFNQMMKALENHPLHQMTKALERQAPELLAFQERADALQRAWPSNALAPGLAFQPSVEMIASLSAQLAHAIGPYQSATTSIKAWERSLATGMAGLDAPWAISEHLGQSMIGFARLARLGEAVHATVPYAKDVGEFVTSELGSVVETSHDVSPLARDAAAIDAGLNPELIAFPRSSYNRVVFSAGFEFSIPPTSPPQAKENNETDATFDPSHGHILTHVEQRLRQFITQRLHLLSGDNWIKQRVPEALRNRWLSRQSDDRSSRRPVYDLIQYADFMDLADIVVRKDNWHDVFGVVFLEKDDFVISFRRLHPIRKAIAHSRPIGRADILILMSEATRLLHALGERTML